MTLLTGIALAAAPALYIALPPSVYEVRHGTQDPTEIRRWAVVSSVIVVALGVLAMAGTQTPVPLIAALAGAALVYGAYEYALRTR